MTRYRPRLGEADVEFFPAAKDRALIESATEYGMFFFVRVKTDGQTDTGCLTKKEEERNQGH
jgi:hypothetical protein